ncbi:hypothetical protein JM658_04515 [Joostella atrarenae]|uniref:LAGLIDADG homing endonuclease n=1 Tax=Joostella atrarenae TaxID=679257 RepID=A0ABS9J0W9_9FLAO|nr:hypothetical protein [Joostella atrarenae]MCF8714084.1 hypothetical protein [Joostella atrarenae]
MLLNLSYNDPIQKKKLLEEVGTVITLKERIKMGGIGSPKLFITACSIDIHNLLILDNNTDTCNIEIRKKGIIIRFRSLLETYGLIIPYYKLSLLKGSVQEYTIHKDHHFIRVAAKTKEVHTYIKKLSAHKIDYLTNISENP